MKEGLAFNLLDISTEDLLNEVLARCSPSIFIGTKNEGNKGNYSFLHHEGDIHCCIGLCSEMKSILESEKIKKIIIGMKDV